MGSPSRIFAIWLATAVTPTVTAWWLRTQTQYSRTARTRILQLMPRFVKPPFYCICRSANSRSTWHVCCFLQDKMSAPVRWCTQSSKCLDCTTLSPSEAVDVALTLLVSCTAATPRTCDYKWEGRACSQVLLLLVLACADQCFSVPAATASLTSLAFPPSMRIAGFRRLLAASAIPR